MVRCTTTAPDRPTRSPASCPPPAVPRGFGLWLIHQFTNIDVALLATADGFTVRLRGGGLPTPADSAAGTGTPSP